MKKKHFSITKTLHESLSKHLHSYSNRATMKRRRIDNSTGSHRKSEMYTSRKKNEPTFFPFDSIIPSNLIQCGPYAPSSGREVRPGRRRTATPLPGLGCTCPAKGRGAAQSSLPGRCRARSRRGDALHSKSATHRWLRRWCSRGPDRYASCRCLCTSVRTC